MLGMKSFSVSGVNTLSFSSAIDVTTRVSSSLAFKHFYFMYWSFKLRVCPAAFPYFQASTLLCFDICPAGLYGDGPTLACQPCHYSCLTCAVISTNCTTCDSTAHRNLSTAACPPVPGYYDNKTTIAVLCTTQDVNCLACTNNTGVWMCQNCTTGFFLDPTGSCKACDPSCATCIDGISCATCPTRFIIDPSTRLCIYNPCTDPNCLECTEVDCLTCVIGYYANGELCLTECGDNITAGT
jgi:hypothetical protein